MAKKTFKRATWHTNPESLTTERVQFWTREGSMLGVVSLAAARAHVASGSCFVISDQAIGQN